MIAEKKDTTYYSNSLEGRETNISKNSGVFDAERVLYILLGKWPIIVFSIFLVFSLSQIYLRYTIPKYSVVTKLLIKDTRNSSGMSETVVFQDLGILNAGRNIDNEVQILKTFYLMEEVVKRLNLQYSYVSQGRLKSSDLYKESEVTVLAWEPQDSNATKSHEIHLKFNKGNQIEATLGTKVYKGQIGQLLKLPIGNLTLGIEDYRRFNSNFNSSEITLHISPISVAAAKFNSSLAINLDLKSRGTVLEIVFLDVNPQRGLDILNKLVEVYNETEITDKNRIYENTVKFIDERMNILGTELRSVEGAVADFKSKKGAVDLGGEGSLLLGESSVNNKEIVALEAEIQIIGAIKAQLQKDAAKFDFVPAGESLSSDFLRDLVSTFNQTLIERERLMSKLGAKNPEIESIERQIINLRLNILETMGSIERDLTVKKNSLLTQSMNITSRIRTLPETQKQLLEIQRQQSIKQELYLYLLQKREEAALSLSVTVANNRVIEPPRFTGKVSPKENQVKLIALSVGAFLPIFILLLLQAINRKVMVEGHITAQTSAPILGTIPQSELKDSIVINERNRSAIAEMFRLIRANFQFVGSGVDNKVICFTSSVSGEGKSFVSLNLGLTFAIGGKRVVLIELDLRKPKLGQYFGFKKGSSKGVTDYLVNPFLKVKDILHATPHNPNLYFISSGPIPPNPSELLLNDRLDQLFSELRKEFDFVMVDTPPIGLVSDALLINKYLDATIFIVRQGVTQQRQLQIVEDIHIKNKMPRVYLIFNGIRFGVGGYGYGGGYGYNYGYNYGYGYGYYAGDRKAVPKWKRVLTFWK